MPVPTLPATVEQAYQELMACHTVAVQQLVKQAQPAVGGGGGGDWWQGIKDWAAQRVGHQALDDFGKNFTSKDPITGQESLSPLSHVLLGGGIGAGAGAVAGGVSGVKKKRTLSNALQGALLGGVGGAGVGALTGFLPQSQTPGPQQMNTITDNLRQALAEGQKREQMWAPWRLTSDMGKALTNWDPGEIWKSVRNTNVLYPLSGLAAAGGVDLAGKMWTRNLNNPALWRSLATSKELATQFPEYMNLARTSMRPMLRTSLHGATPEALLASELNRLGGQSQWSRLRSNFDVPATGTPMAAGTKLLTERELALKGGLRPTWLTRTGTNMRLPPDLAAPASELRAALIKQRPLVSKGFAGTGLPRTPFYIGLPLAAEIIGAVINSDLGRAKKPAQIIDEILRDTSAHQQQQPATYQPMSQMPVSDEYWNLIKPRGAGANPTTPGP